MTLFTYDCFGSDGSPFRSEPSWLFPSGPSIHWRSPSWLSPAQVFARSCRFETRLIFNAKKKINPKWNDLFS